jgi:hypothetical protein
MDFLSCYSKVTVDVLDVVFKDNNARNWGEENHKDSYSCKVKLNKELPQLAAIMGKRV